MGQNEVESFLEHWGVKGMHWGIRNARNRRAAARAEQKKAHEDFKTIQKLRKKKVSELSTSDLKLLNDRANAENNFKRLHQGKVSKGKAVVAGILVGAATTEAQRVVSSSLRKRGAAFFGRSAAKVALSQPAQFVIKEGESFV